MVKKGLKICNELEVRDPREKMMRRAESEHTRKRYDRTAFVYDLMEFPVERLLFRKWRAMLWERVEGPSVLEIGVGTGKNIAFYPDTVTVTGIDLSRNMLEKACRRARKYSEKRIVLDLMDAQELAFEDHQFDEVVATFAFCSVPDPIRGLREAMRVVRPGGRLQLLEHVRAERPMMGKLMDRLDGPFHYLSGVHIARNTVRNVKRADWKILEDKKLTGNGIFRYIHAEKASN